MAITLPPVPRLAAVSPRLITFGADLTPPLGGPTQRIRRLGSRFAVDVQLPALDRECGMRWVAALIRAEAEGQTLRLAFPKVLANAVTPSVGSSNQQGTALGVSALSAAVLAGSFFSFEAAGRAFLHMVTANAAADATALNIAPLLRASPAAGTALNFAEPVIEGFVDPGPIGWEQQLKRFASLKFTLTENR